MKNRIMFFVFLFAVVSSCSSNKMFEQTQDTVTQAENLSTRMDNYLRKVERGPVYNLCSTVQNFEKSTTTVYNNLDDINQQLRAEAQEIKNKQGRKAKKIGEQILKIQQIQTNLRFQVGKLRMIEEQFTIKQT